MGKTYFKHKRQTLFFIRDDIVVKELVQTHIQKKKYFSSSHGLKGGGGETHLQKEKKTKQKLKEKKSAGVEAD